MLYSRSTCVYAMGPTAPGAQVSRVGPSPRCLRPNALVARGGLDDI